MDIIKTRTIEFNHVRDFSNADRYTKILNQQSGIIEVKLNYQNGQIKIRYNLQMINMKKIEALLSEAGFVWPNSFWKRTRRNWRHYIEKNEQDNINMPVAPCCSHPDDILGKVKTK